MKKLMYDSNSKRRVQETFSKTGHALTESEGGRYEYRRKGGCCEKGIKSCRKRKSFCTEHLVQGQRRKLRSSLRRTYYSYIRESQQLSPLEGLSLSRRTFWPSLQRHG